MVMLWDQHRERYGAGGYTVRRIPSCKFTEMTRGVSPEELAKLGRLNAKRESGVQLDQEDTDTLNAIASKWPVDALRGACFIPPVSAEKCRQILADMSRRDSEALEEILDDMITPEIPQEDCQDPVALALVRTGGLGIDVADMTVGQGYAIAAMLATPQEAPQ